MTSTHLVALLLTTVTSLSIATRPACAAPASGEPATTVDLEQGFADPPRDARTRCFWWWLNGNVTKQAITRDLDQMKAKGYGGALLFDADGASQRGNRPVPAGPMFGSPAWRELFKHTLQEAHRLGLELSLSIQSGWNLGGPTITPDEAAKQLTWSQLRVDGPKDLDAMLPAPRQRDGYYQEVATLAYRLKPRAVPKNPATIKASSAQKACPASRAFDGDPSTYWVSAGLRPGHGPTDEKPQWLQLTFKEPVTVARIEVRPRSKYGPRACVLEASNDGRSFKEVARLEMRADRPGYAEFDPVDARVFRLRMPASYDPRFPDTPRNVQVAEWCLFGADGKHLEGLVRRRPIQLLRQKSAFRELGGSAPDCRPLLDDIPARPGEQDVRAADIINLTDRVDAKGRLRWSVPEGTWLVLRFGTTLTGAKVSTSSGKWQGLVLDYMSTPVLLAYWNRHVRPLLDDAGPLVGNTLKYLHTDSWECGGMNWTPGFEAEFKKRRGYDPIPYLPVLADKIVDSRLDSNRFLADFRKTIGDCVAENHYEVFARLAHEAGLGIHPESGGPHAGPFDGIKCLGRSDMPMSEFWVPSPHRPRPGNRFFVKQASSAAHIYGRRLVGAEGFTSIGPHWDDILWSSAKPSFDHEACAGLNLTFIHTFTSSPPEMGLPGQEYFAGTHFNPNVTWWHMVGPFISYLNRCHFMLQQGRFIADVLYYYGDHVPNIARRKGDDPAGTLPGYDYDVINEEVLCSRLSFKHGRLTLPSPMRYRVLVLPDHAVLSLEALKKVGALVRAGATVIGPKPERMMTRTGLPESERAFHQLADELWGDATSKTGRRPCGKGRVIWGRSARDVLLADGVPFDCEFRGADGKPLDAIHHRVGDADVYFVSNQAPQDVRVRGVFRVSGKRPELWDAVTGRIRDAVAFRQTDGRTELPLTLAPYGSIFVVFRQAIGPDVAGPARRNMPACKPIKRIEGPWEVRFDPNWGGPKSVTFDKLVSWTERDEPGIRYYSGTATYRKTLTVPSDFLDGPGNLVLDLGDFSHMARVRLNGQDLGVVWTKPFRVDITQAARPGENALEIDVVNNWTNRLVGDASLPDAKRRTRTNIAKITKDTPLQPSGLFGPVRLMRAGAGR